MEKHLLKEDTKQIEHYKKLLDKTVVLLQKVVNELIPLGVEPNILHIESLLAISSNNSLGEKQFHVYLKDHIKGILAEKVANPEIGGVKISKEAFKEIIHVPDCTSLIENLNALLNETRYNWGALFNFRFFEIVGTEVSVSEYGKTELSERFRIYITTEKQMEAYNYVLTIVDTYNKLKDIGVAKSNLIIFEDGVAEVNCLTVSNIQ